MASSLTEVVFQMVARHELTADQARSLLTKLGPRLSADVVSDGHEQPAIAIIGIGGRFPGAADPAQLWRNLAAGRVSTGEVTPDRWNIDEFYDPRPGREGKTNCKWAGLLADVDKFDSLFFNISPKEAALMDPQQRLFLEIAWSAMEDAGLPESRLSGSRCGVFVGAGAGDYAQSMQAAAVTPDAYAFMGNAPSILAARISYALNLKGPAIAIDTACSSSLVAVHLACESIANGGCDIAIAGGVCVLTSPNFFIAAGKAGMLSSSGQCRAFDHGADGFIAAEAVGAVILKPLSKAQADGDFIYAVIRGSAINQDGRTNGITAPCAASQSAVELAAYERARINPATIGHVEAHGTGTKLGDPIEVEALTEAFRVHTAERQFCSIGSIKSNIGHTMTAAGIASLVKVVLAMKHRQLPPSANYQQENEAIGFERTPFYVCRDLLPWHPVGNCSQLRAAVSSFGFSGTNAHLVLEEAPASERRSSAPGPFLIPISAKSTNSFQERFRDLAQWVRDEGAQYNLSEISESLSAGRNHFEIRATTIVNSQEELVTQLQAVSERNDWSGWRVSSTAKLSGVEESAPLIGNEHLQDLAASYVAGRDVDWSGMHDGSVSQRIPLPAYPFERTSHWFTRTVQNSNQVAQHSLRATQAKPDEPSIFKLTLRRSDPFLRDHAVHGRSILPGVCHLEMARATLAGGDPSFESCTFQSVQWRSPLIVEETAAEVVVRVTDQSDGRIFEVSSKFPDETVHCVGVLTAASLAGDSQRRLDVRSIRNRCQKEMDPVALYQAFASAGVECGPFCQGVEKVWLGDGEALAKITHSNVGDCFVLHPTLMDAAFQTAMALISASPEPPVNVMVPFSVEKVSVLSRPARESHAWVRLKNADPAGVAQFDIDIVDAEGNVCIAIQDLCAKAYRESQPQTKGIVYYKPGWTIADLPRRQVSRNEGRTLILHPPSDFGFTSMYLKAQQPGTHIDVLLGSHFRKLRENNIEIDHRRQHDFDQLLREYPDASEIIFAALQDSADDRLDVLEDSEQLGAYSLLRLVKALPGGRSLNLKILCNNVHRVLSGDTIYPFSGAISGLAKTAARELDPVRVSSIEFTKDDFQQNPVELIRLIHAETESGPGKELVLRRGTRYTRLLRSIDLSAPSIDELPVRTGGVYVIVGGIGGIGLTLARHLASNWQAHLVLTGRGEIGSRRDAVEELKKLGASSVSYRQADVTDLEAMQAVVAEGEQTWGGIHGVIHSAIVLKDRSLRRMDEETFRDVLAPKVRGAVVLQQVTADKNLDFLLFFSSANSIFGNAGQGNYAAASTFEDVFALHLLHQKNRPVRVYNWGYWGEVGVVSSATYQERISRLGVGAIKSREGIQAFDAVLGSSVPQVMPIKIDAGLFQKLGVHVLSEESPVIYRRVVDAVERRANREPLLEDAGQAFELIEQYSRGRLVRFLSNKELLNPSQVHGIASLKSALGLAPKYNQLFEAFLDILARERVVRIESDTITVAPEAAVHCQQQSDILQSIRSAISAVNSDLKPFLDLLDACFDSYEQILSGDRPATDILFPGSSTALVENLYKRNAVSDYYNALVAEAVAAAVDGFRLAHPNCGRVRLLEIGAGTGGSTEGVLDRIQAHHGDLDFDYTDVSPSLVEYGRRMYGSRYSFLRARTLDIEKPPAQQGFHERSFDILIATNVLHATRDIARTGRHVSSLLTPGGLLILNEATALRDFATVTFGLTDGWWLFEDGKRRLPGSPLLDLRQWRDVLGQSGFTKCRAFPQGVSGRPQSVIIAELDDATDLAEHPEPIVVKDGRRDAKQVTTISSDQRQSFIESTIKSQLCAVLNLSPPDVRRDKRFADYGVDSIMAVDLVAAINRNLGTDLRTTILFDYPTISELSGYILTDTKFRIDPSISTGESLTPKKSESDVVAVVGVSGRFPGAPNISTFWENLINGRSAASAEAASRRWGAASSDRMDNRWGCFLEDIDRFDPLFFNMSGKDAELTDPQQRLFLEETWKALEDAGYSDRLLNNRKCGVFVGVGPSDYTHRMIAEGTPPDPRAFVGNASSVLASRISYFLNLKGPSIAIDTACSSSLVAVHLACQSLLTGESDLAIAGGAFISTSPGFQILTSMAGMLSPEGKCRAFDDNADGFVPGEAVAAVVLKRVKDAIADGDQIYGVIRGSGVNQDGRTNGITAPSSISQSDLEIDVYARAGVDPSTITYVEAHGTGTKLGDPVEFEALTKAFRTYTDERQFCAIGSVKTNIGHCSTAAGITGLIKVLLSLKHKRIPPSLHFDRPNSLIRFEESPFYVNGHLADWKSGDHTPRRAAVSSFGLSGTNAHIVLEEAPLLEKRSEVNLPYQIATISAKTETALCDRMRDLQRLLEQDSCPNLADVCYTLNAARSHFPIRFAIVASDRTDLSEKLALILRGERHTDCIRALQNEPDDADLGRGAMLENLVTSIRNGPIGGDEQYRDLLISLADYYTHQYEIDWPRLYAGQAYRQVSLPPYPFSNERYWLPRSSSEARPALAPEHAAGQSVESRPFYYEPYWKETSFALRSSVPFNAEALVLFERGSAASDEIERQMASAGRQLSIISVHPGDRYEMSGPLTYLVRPGSFPDYEMLLTDLKRRGISPAYIAHCWQSSDISGEDDFGRRIDLGIHSVAGLARALVQQKLNARCVVVYQEQSSGAWPEQAALAAVSRDLSMLTAGVRLTTIRLSPEAGPPAVADAVISELGTAETQTHEVCHRNGARFVRTFRRLATDGSRTTISIRVGGVYLISGGCGALGSLVAKHLAERYAAKLVLTGRRAVSSESASLLSDIEMLGGKGIYLAADVSDEAAMRKVIDTAKATYGKLDGVIHAAGLLNGKPLQAKSQLEFDEVLRPKLYGATILDQLTREEDLAFFALFSSVASILGDFGQCDYAVGNSFLDAFAERREQLRAAGLRRGKTVSIGWSLWEKGGSHFSHDGDRLYLEVTGLNYLTTANGIRAFEQALSFEAPHVLVLDGDRSRIDKTLGVEEKHLSPDHVLTPPPVRLAEPRPAATLEVCLRDIFSDCLRIDIERLARDTSFSEFGVDSIAVKDITNRLNRDLNLDLSPAVLFAYSSIRRLASYLQEHYGAMIDLSLNPKPDVPQSQLSSPLPMPDAQIGSYDDGELIAIVGASGRFPKSNDLDAFWQHLVQEHDLVTEVPSDRWRWQDSYSGEAQPGKSVSRWGGFMEDVDKFDAAFFHISPREAAFMDPQHRLMLETAWKTFEDAGHSPSEFAGRRVGIFIGAQFNEYMGLAGDAGEARAQAALGSTHTMLANRISYFLDFRGPSEVVDTACSSALIAIHRAVQSIRTGECEMALAGGVSLMLSPETFVLASQLGMLSADGRCKTFDKQANGYVKGEGVGAVLLKPLKQAVSDNDHIYAVIRATAENHGGRANSLTAPNAAAQTELLVDAYKKAGIDHGAVSYIEAHGTGTELGDPVEIEALSAAFHRLEQSSARTSPVRNPCGLGSVKTNIGHLEPAAGIAGLLKVILAIRNKMLPATLHVENVNPYIHLDGTPFYLVTKTKSWDVPAPRIAGVSSFGFGGSNAHIVLEEYVERRAPDVAAGSPLEHLILLSAKSKDRLTEYARTIHDWIVSRDKTRQLIPLSDVAFTLQIGREPMEERLAIVTSSFDDLRNKLDAFLNDTSGEGMFRSTATGSHLSSSLLDGSPEAAEFVRATVANRRLGRLAKLWAEGAHIDWAGIHSDSCRRVSLPTYPFARQRHWVNSHTSSKVAVPPAIGILPEPPSPVTPAVAVDLSKRTAAMKDKLRAMLAAALYMEPGQIEDDVSFSELGLDSILAVELVHQLNNEFGTDFKATRLYDYSNLNELSAFLAQTTGEPTQTASQLDVNEVSMVGSSVTTTKDILQKIFATILALPLQDIDVAIPLGDLGLDFVLAAEVTQAINEKLGTELISAKLYEFASITDLALYLDRLPTVKRSQLEIPVTTPLPENSSSADGQDDVSNHKGSVEKDGRKWNDGIAIIGMSGRFPNARNVEELWQNLAAGRDSVSEVPPSRWDLDRFFNADPTVPGTTYSRWCALLEDVDKFDPLFFGIPPRDAEIMEPQQRIFLEEAWRTFEDAGYSATSLNNTRCAVFAGTGQGDYYLNFPADDTILSAQMGMGNVPSILAARIAYFLNLKGAAVPIDTACSSSLVALHLGCRALLNGEADLALAGGICVLTTSRMHIITSQARMLSPEGKCKTFDNSADGFVPGEAVGLVLLKRLSDAVRDGDHIYGVIRGSGMNQDGKTNGITAPSTLSQTALELSVYESGGIDPDTITLIEAHGTGTKLGDPIEIEALTDAFRKYTDRNQYCAIGSLKTNIGHTLFAAGVAGVIKVLLSLKYRQIPPSLHYETKNEHIDFCSSPFFVNTQLRSWDTESGKPRRAAISSFGWSGTNTHVVIEEAPPRESVVKSAQSPYYLANMSAKSRTALEARLRDLSRWLQSEGAEHDAENLSFTLNVGRTHFGVRTSFIFSDYIDLASSISSFLSTGVASDGQIGPPNTNERFESPVTNAEAVLASTQYGADQDPADLKKKLLLLGRAYVEGVDLHWSKLHVGRTRRIPLPSYPFARRHCWIETSHNTVADGRRSTTLHPLLDESVADLSGALFQKAFKNTEPVLAGHIVQGQTILPGVAYLEMARAAATAVRISGNTVLIRNVAWRKPLSVNQSGAVVLVKLTPKETGCQFSVTSNTDGAEAAHCTGEVACSSDDGTIDPLDLAAIMRRCQRQINGSDIYRVFESRGIQYGSCFRTIESIYAGSNESIAVISVSDDTFRDPRWKLSPGILDAALQSVLGLLVNETENLDSVMLPFSVDEVCIVGELPRKVFAYATRVKDERSSGSTYRFNIQLTDTEGRGLVQVREFAVRPIRKTPERETIGSCITLRPIWKAAITDSRSAVTLDEGTILLVRSAKDFGLSDGIRQLSERGTVHEVLLGSSFSTGANHRWEIDHRSLSDFDRVLREIGSVSTIYFLGGLQASAPATVEDLDNSQQLGVLSLFRLVKALMQTDRGRVPLTLKIVTNNVNAVLSGDKPYSPAGSLMGFAKVVAQEYPHCHLVTIDIQSDDVTSGRPERDELLRSLVTEASAEPVPEIAYRNGFRYVRKLEPVDLSTSTGDVAPLRYRGVYLIAGGAGGIGSATARWLASQCRARIALLGRSPLDDRKSALLKDIEAAGGEALYVKADLTNMESVRLAMRVVRERWKTIHGVIHSTVVLDDRTIGGMDERGLEAVLAPKVTGSFVLVNALAEYPLDFIGFYSSSVSFTGGAGQANYAAASTFEDAYAIIAARSRQVRTFIINWGYWGDVGVVATEHHRKRASNLGVGSISAAEGMAVLQKMLTSGISQVAAIKVGPQLLAKFGIDTSITQAKVSLSRSSVIEEAVRDSTILGTSGGGSGVDRDAVARLERYARCSLATLFRREGGLSEPGTVHTVDEIGNRLQSATKSNRLLLAFLDILHRAGFVERQGDRLVPTKAIQEAEREAQMLRGQLSNDAEVRSALNLLDACIPHHLAMLRGSRSGTSVLVPNGSVALTEPVYTGNRFEDFYNKLAAECVRSAVESWIERNEDGRIRVLEIGAGTGTTSVHVLDALRSFGDRVDYCYSDLSPAFLRHGRERFAASYGFTTFRTLDIERPPEAQDFDLGTMDIVLASNVFHATRQVSVAVEHAKRLLKERGLLVLNEINAVSDFSIMTFGLTNEWWLFEDTAIRQPNSPFLDSRQWEQVLAEHGFENITLLGSNADSAAQCVIVSESDGWIARKILQETQTPAVEPVPRVINVSNGNGHHPPVEHPVDISPDLESVARRYLTGIFVELLKLEESEVDSKAPFETYGVDSLIALEIANRLQSDIGLVSPAILLEHGTIDALSQYLSRNKAVELQKLVSPSNGTQHIKDNGYSTSALEARSVITPVRTTGDGPATFWIHGLLGETNWVVRLGRHLSSPNCVYGLRAVGLDGKTEPHTSVEQMAECYADAIRSIHPHGPYVLGGYSSGGTVAFELAQILRRSGESVSHLFLLDSYAPGSAMIESLFNTSDETWLLLAIGNLFALQWNASRLIEPTSLSNLDRPAQLRVVTDHLKQHCGQQVSAFQDLSGVIQNMLGVAAASGEAFRSYSPKPFPVDLNATLLRCDDGLVGHNNTLNLPPLGAGRYEADNGWSRWIPANLAVIPVPGDHFSVGLEPGIRLVADHIASILYRGAESAAITVDGQY